MLTCKNTLSNRFLVVEEVTSDKTQLAFYPDTSPADTVWLDADDVALLAHLLATWAKKRGGKIYTPPNVKGGL
jgi:hypothetical protein